MESWNPNIPDQSPSSIDFWVQIKNIPLQFLSISLVNYIAESLGEIVETDETGFGSTAISGRVCIRWPIDHPLVFERVFQFGHDSATITFRFEKLRNYCFRCHSLQHGIDDCEIHEADAAMGHQEPDPTDGNIQDIVQVQHPVSNHTPIHATPLQAISPSGHILALPSSICEPIDMESATILIDGR